MLLSFQPHWICLFASPTFLVLCQLKCNSQLISTHTFPHEAFPELLLSTMIFPVSSPKHYNLPTPKGHFYLRVSWMKQEKWLILLNIDPQVYIILILCELIGSMHKALLLHTEIHDCLKEKAIVYLPWPVTWISGFFHWISFSLERTTDREIMVIRSWVLGKIFLKNERC